MFNIRKINFIPAKNSCEVLKKVKTSFTYIVLYNCFKVSNSRSLQFKEAVNFSKFNYSNLFLARAYHQGYIANQILIFWKLQIWFRLMFADIFWCPLMLCWAALFVSQVPTFFRHGNLSSHVRPIGPKLQFDWSRNFG